VFIDNEIFTLTIQPQKAQNTQIICFRVKNFVNDNPPLGGTVLWRQAQKHFVINVLSVAIP
jgi:hypothetical protein